MDAIGPIAPDILADRRHRFQAALGDGLALVPGASRTYRTNDIEHVFRQNSDLLYLTGFEEPDALALFTRERFVLFTQPRDPAAETWTGRRSGVEGAVRDHGADAAYPVAELGERLAVALENVTRLYHGFGEHAELDAIVLAAIRGVRGKARKGIQAPSEMICPASILHEMRLYKDPAELAILRAAAEISEEAHQAAARLCEAGRFEYELEAALEQVFRARGGAGPAYPSIVGSGANATILHYTENRDRLAPGELVLIDAGTELHGYASDVTRVYPVGGRFEGAARDVYALVLQAQRDTIEAIRPGITLPALHEVAVETLTRGLIELGVLPSETQAGKNDADCRRFYMHSTSHFLGLDVHDVGNYNVGGQPRPLEPGMVFTVEPGLYFAAGEEAVPAALRGIGVRIEDDVVITDHGFEIITAAIPKELDAVEVWMRK